MERAVVVRGNLANPRRVDLDEPVDDLAGPVEVVLRSTRPTELARRDVFDVIASMAPGNRTKQDIDRQIDEERDDWGPE